MSSNCQYRAGVDGVELEQGQANAEIGHPALGIVVGAGALGPVAGADLGSAVRGPLGIEELALVVVEPGAQDFHGLGLVLVLGFFILLGNHDPGGQMGDADRRVRDVDMLTARARRTAGVDAKLGLVDLDRVDDI